MTEMRPSEPVEIIKKDSLLLAIIIRSTFREFGLHFLTEDEMPAQLAYMRHPAGKEIQPHLHNDVARTVLRTQEVLFVKSGKVRVDLYSEHQAFLESRILQAGDVILLAHGGHGFEILEEAEIFEVKNGPYAGNQDKIKFTPKGAAHV